MSLYVRTFLRLHAQAIIACDFLVVVTETFRLLIADDKDHFRKLDPYLRNLRLDAIDMNALQPFVRNRKTKSEVANATINRALEVVQRVLNVAHQDWRWLRAVPKIRMLKEPRRRVRF